MSITTHSTISMPFTTPDGAGTIITAADAINELIRVYGEDPVLVKQHINLSTNGSQHQFYTILEPAILKHDAWFREDTIREEKGTDAETRIFTNEVWEDNSRLLKAKVRSEYGKFTDVTFEVIW